MGEWGEWGEGEGRGGIARRMGRRRCSEERGCRGRVGRQGAGREWGEGGAAGGRRQGGGGHVTAWQCACRLS